MKVTINTDLVGKNDAFSILALATACKMPLLINGEKGTAKTAAVLDFAKSLGNNDSFIIELSEGTKAPHLLGQPDMKALMVDKDWKMNRPIAKAKTVVINEVDKASSAIRNVLLSIMSEKQIFDGGETTDCQWDTFVATSNEIPKGEEHLPFWDRLVLRYEMPTVSNKELVQFMQDRTKKDVMTINIPTMEEIDATPLNYEYIEKMVDLISKSNYSMSNRTLTKLDRLVKAATHVYDMTEEEAVIKIATIVAAPIVGELGKSLLPVEISHFNSAKELFDKAASSGANGNKVGMLTASHNLQSALEAIYKNPKLRDKHYDRCHKIERACFHLIEKQRPQMEEELNF